MRTIIHTSRVVLLFALCCLGGCAPDAQSKPSLSKAKPRAAAQPTGSTADPLEFNLEQKTILDAVLEYVLTDPDLKDTREFYGNPRGHTFTLVDNSISGVAWPQWFRPSLRGFTYIEADDIPTDPNSARLLGIQLDKFSMPDGEENTRDERSFFDGDIQVTLSNAGGDGGGSIHTGGCIGYFDVVRDEFGWTVKCNGWIDP